MNNLIILLMLFPLLSFSQDNDSDIDSDSVTVEDIEGRLDFNIPATPAFSIIGATAENVIEAGTPSSFAFNLLTSDDDLGNGQSGVAFSFRPYFLWLSPKSTLKEIGKHAILNSLSISYIDVEGTDDTDKTNRRGLGLRFSLFDSTDPLRGKLKGMKTHSDCIQNKKDELINQKESIELIIATGKESNPEFEQTEEYKKAAKKENEIHVQIVKAKNKYLSETCLKKYKAHPNYKTPTQWQVGLAFHKSNVNDINESGNSIWTSYSMPVPRLDKYYLISHLRSGSNIIQATNDEDNPFNIVDEDVFGLRIKTNRNKWSFMLEGAHIRNSVKGINEDDSYNQVLLGAEYNLYKNVWLHFGIGDTFGRNIGDNDTFFNGQFRYAFGDKLE